MEYAPTGSDTPVFIDTEYTTYGVVQKAQAKEKGSDRAKILYPGLDMVPGSPDEFELTRNLTLAFRPKDTTAQGTVTMSNIAAFLPCNIWANSPLVHIVYTCKWNAAGLMPIRAMVTSKVGFKIPAKKAVAIV